MTTPSKIAFLGITKINKTPVVNLSDPAEVSGEARILDSLGREVTVSFHEATCNGVSWPLALAGGDDFQAEDYELHEDGEAYMSGVALIFIDDMQRVEEWIANAIYDLDLRASQAAEDAWNEVWVDAAVKAEQKV